MPPLRNLPPHGVCRVPRPAPSTWAPGGLGTIGERFREVGGSLCDAAGVRAGERVLVVAAGSGHAAWAAARLHADVTAAEPAAALLEPAVREAAAGGLRLRTNSASASELPFPDGAFDAALSAFGVMFEPRPELAAHELLRVVRPGGRVALANWTAASLVGQLFESLARFAPPPAGLAAPAAWGDETSIVQWFGPCAAQLRTIRRSFVFRDASAAACVESLRSHDGAVSRAFDALTVERQLDLRSALEELLARHHLAPDASFSASSEYLEVVITRA